MLRSTILSVVTSACVLLLCVANTDAEIVIDFSNEGSGTRVDISGSLDTSGLNFSGIVTSSFLNMQSNSELWFAGSPDNYRWAGHGQQVPNWHAFSQVNLPFSDVTGTDFGFNGANVNLPDGYVSGAPLSSSFLINGVSLNDLDLQPGVVLTLGNGDTIEVNSIPEPSALTVILGLGTAFFVRRNRSSAR